MSDEVFLVGAANPVIDGCTEHACSSCKAVVYLSPGSDRVLKERNPTILCMSCAVPRIESGEAQIEAADFREFIVEVDRLLSKIERNETGKYILVDRVPVPEPDLMRWALWLEESSNRVVKQELVGAYQVSTVFLGLDHNHSRKGPPILFETMIFLDGSRYSGLDHQTRCATWDEAEQMHAAAVAAVRKMLAG